MAPTESQSNHAEVEKSPHFVDAPGAEQPQAWEEIAAGRYMPRRTRGSCKGRALG